MIKPILDAVTKLIKHNSAYARGMNYLFENKLQLAENENNHFALALILQQALFYSQFHPDRSYRPKYIDDSRLYNLILEEYQNTIDKLTQEHEICTEPKLQQKYRAAIVLHKYFSKENADYKNTQGFYIHEYKMAYSLNCSRLVALADLYKLESTAENSANLRFEKFKKDLFFSKMCDKELQHYQTPSEIFYKTRDEFKKRICELIEAHKRFCDKHAVRHGTFEYLIAHILTGTLENLEIPSLEDGFDDKKLPNNLQTLFKNKATQAPSMLQRRWLKELSAESNFKSWSQVTGTNAKNYALNKGLLAFGLACLLAGFATLVVAGFMVGLGQLKVLEKAATWIVKHALIYTGSIVSGAALTGVVSYQYRKREYTFKQNEILGCLTNNNSQTLNNQ